jgi:hypothetical protein
MDGFVKFSTKKVRAFTGKMMQRRFVSVATKIVPTKKVKEKTKATVKTTGKALAKNTAKTVAKVTT